MKRVDFICVGAAKSGTTALDHYLRLHPEIQMPTMKSTRYFTFHRDKGKSWYHSHFENPQRLWGECTYGYGIEPKALKAISEYHPKIQLWLLIRDPVDRIVSHLWYLRRTESLNDMQMHLALDKLKFPSYLWTQSDYPAFVSRIGKYAPKCQLKILPSGVLYRNPTETMNTLFELLGVSRLEEIQHEVKNHTEYDPTSQEIRGRLAKVIGDWRTDLQKCIDGCVAQVKVLQEDFTWGETVALWSKKATVTKV